MCSKDLLHIILDRGGIIILY